MTCAYDNSRRILFVVSYSWEKKLGGHLFSAISLAKGFVRRGYKVGLLVAPGALEVPELKDPPFQLHISPYPSGLRGYQLRARAIRRTVKKGEYHVIVAMDWRALLQATLALFLAPISLIQVQMGGKVSLRPFLKLPGIVVFSQEYKNHLVNERHLPPEYVFFSEGRVDFLQFGRKMMPEDVHSLGFSVCSPRLLTISRLPKAKALAISALLEQIDEVAQSQPIQLVVVGDGEEKTHLEQQAHGIMDRSEGRAVIRFVGGFRVTPAHLRQSDLVIGQGRTVIEALASGVPAAVCGADGYFGIIDSEMLPVLAPTNLTGRGLRSSANLKKDLERLTKHVVDDFAIVQSMARQRYDVNQGIVAIEEACCAFSEFADNCRSWRGKLVIAFAETMFQHVRLRVQALKSRFTN